MVNKDLEDFTTSTIRGNKRGARGQAIGFQLAKAASSNEPLIKILSLCEAALMFKKQEELDHGLIDCCMMVAQSFINTTPFKREGTNYYKMFWSFSLTEENYKKFVEPWQHNRNLTFYTL